MKQKIPQDAIDIFSRPDHNKPLDVVRAKVCLPNGKPCSYRTARRWKQNWKRGNYVVVPPAVIHLDKAIQDQPEESLTKAEIDGEMRVKSVSEIIKTYEDLIRVGQVDLEKWECTHYEESTWMAHRKNEEKDLLFDEGKITGSIRDTGDLRVVTMFSVVAHFKRRKSDLYIDAFKDVIKHLETRRSAPSVKRNYAHGRKLFMPSFADLHINRLAVGKPYSVEQAVDEYVKAGELLLSRALGMNMEIDKILFPLNGDAADVDGLDNKTTRGTDQHESADIRYAVRLLGEGTIRLIERYTEVAPVKMIATPGNHDQALGYMVGLMIESYFKGQKNNDVEVVVDTDPYHFDLYGPTLLMFDHGDQIKPDKLVGILAFKAKELWSLAKYYMCFRGHWHVKNTQVYPLTDVSGVVMVTLPAFCPPNMWEQKMGFISAPRSAEGWFFDLENGPAGSFPVFASEVAVT